MGSKAFLEEVVNDNGAKIDLVNEAGRYPGSWTLPVCDTSTYGDDWNVPYDNKTYYNGRYPESTHPPCMCGMTSSLVPACRLMLIS